MASANTIGVGALAIAAVGLGAWILMSSPDEDSAPTAGRDRGRARSSGEDGERSREALEDRVVALEGEVAQMKRQLTGLRMTRTSAAARGATAEDDELEAIAEDGEFEGVVRDIIETEREEAREKRTDMMRERFAERHREVLDQLAATAGLAKSEQESIETLWETETDKIIPLFAQAREGDRPFREVREEADEIRAATDASVEEMLTPEQFQTYEEMRPGPPRGGGRGGRRGDRDASPPPSE